MIKIYTIPDCEHCEEAKKYFVDNKIEYEEINLKEGGNKETLSMKRKFKKLGIDKVPIIVLDEDNILSEFDEDIIKSVIGK